MEPEIINAEPMRQRRKYDSFIVWLYNQNKEHLLPAAFVKSIPASTRHDWRNMDYYSAYTGSRFAGIQQEGLRYCELFLKYRNLKRTFDVVSRVWVMVSDIMLPCPALHSPCG